MSSDDEIPWDGLEEVLRGWNGRGQLYEALAAVEDDLTELHWDRHDIERRARRILLARLEPDLDRWPTSADAWLHALPAESLRRRRMSEVPHPGTDWIETRSLGWPAEQFVIKERSRVADQVMSRTLRWVLDQLRVIRRDAVAVDRSLQNVATTQLRAALSLRTQPPLDATDGLRPSSADVRALQRSGRPWSRLAPVAEKLRTSLTLDLLTFAREQLIPDDDIRWRLFQLAVFGKLLKIMRERGAEIANLRPLSGATSSGPCYSLRLNGKEWHLWFEAAGIWDHYGYPSPYKELVDTALGHPRASLGVDILLIAPGEAAYAFECKYGTVSYIANKGYIQACAYGHELRNYLTPNVTSYVVGPDPKVTACHELNAGDFTIGIMGPRHLETLAIESMT
jgi:hypothetical protein